ncbi:MAG: hypothetical protein K2J67_09545, partial [Lachnospiraceae bacterium]|nr:hypothetical protein [Lachnospiraceae bacterium]
MSTTMEKKFSLRKIIQINLQGLSLIYSLIPWNGFMTFLSVLSDVMLSYWNYFFLAKLIDDLLNSVSRETLVWDIGLLTVGHLLMTLIYKILSVLYMYGGSNVWEVANAHLNEKMMSMDYEYMESEAIHNKRRDIDISARFNGGGISILFWYATPVIERGLQMIIALSYTIYLISRCRIAFAGEPLKAIAFVGIFIFLFTLLLIISSKKNKKAQETIHQYNDKNIPIYRHFQFYLNEYIEKEECGKTIRMFHQQNLLSTYVRNLIRKVHENLDKISISDQHRNMWIGATEAIISGLIYFLLGIMVSKNAISIGSVCLYAGCITNFLWHFQMWMEQWVE